MSDPNAGDLVKTGGAAILASLVRTLVPLIVGVIVAGFTKLGVPVDDESVALVINGAVSVAVARPFGNIGNRSPPSGRVHCAHRTFTNTTHPTARRTGTARIR